MVSKPSKKTIKLTFLDKLFVGILLVIFGGIVLHAPISVGFSTLFPDAEVLIKSWKEILMGVAGLLMVVILYQKKQWRLLTSKLVLLIALYAALHLVLLSLFPQGVTAALAGLFIDLRYLFFFVLVYVAIMLYPQLRRTFIVTFFVGAFIVAAFALLQVFVLPVDVLKYIGYNTSTIVPYLTVDQNPDYIRINSTLRGPNPLGAYAGIVIALLFAFWLRVKNYKPGRWGLVISVIATGSFIALWASYSRSAVVAAFVAIGIVALVVAGRRVSKKWWVILTIIILAAVGGLVAARDTNFVSNVLLHENATTGPEATSNDGHVESLRDGVSRTVRQPLGGGIGSTGSASFYGDKPLVIENQYLFIAHEAGWIGLVIFVYISALVMKALWQRRTDWLALGVFASGIGLILIGLLLPVWVDDTVAIIWWGLAAIVLATKGDTDGRTINKTSKRAA